MAEVILAPPPPVQAPAGSPPPPRRLRWRSDLRASAQMLEGTRQVVVEDPIGGRFFRLGANEYALARALDGRRELVEALATANATEKGQPLSPQDAMAIVQFLHRNGLIEELVGGEAQARNQSPPKRPRRLGALFQRVPLVNPNRLLDRLMPLIGWLATPWFLPLWFAAAAWAAMSLAGNWERWTVATGNVLDRDNIIWLPVAWIVLKLWHELNHGVVAKRYGADVVEAGVLFVLFAPVGGYVDATATWRLPNRWQRIHVSAAGIIAEVFLGCVAVVLWAATPPGVLNTIAYYVALLATVSTLLFNGNPLMRFDGYYVLIDLIERPNLYQRGMLYCRWLGRRWLLGQRQVPDPATGPLAPRVVKFYGLATLGWRWMVMISILVMATAWFSGLGLVLCAIGVATWLMLPALRLMKREMQAGGVGGRGLLRAGAIAVAVVGLAALANVAVPLHPSVRVPGLVAYVEATTLRTEVAGYLVETAVRRGDRVAPGQLLVRLENPELALEAAQVEQDMAAMEVEAALALTVGDLETESARRASRAVLASRLAELQRQQAALDVTAPHDGVVVASDLQSWQGAWMRRGDELGELADPSELEFEISIPERLVPSFRAQIGTKVEVELPGGRLFEGRLIEVAPKGSLAKPAEALTALGGGPIALRTVQGAEGAQQQPVEPQFKGVVSLPVSLVAELAAGEVGWVTVRGEERSLFGLAVGAWRAWTDDILAAFESA